MMDNATIRRRVPPGHIEMTGAQATDIALTETLRAGVPLLLAELAQMSDQARRRQIERWRRGAHVLASFGDLLLCRETSRKKDGSHYAACPYRSERPVGSFGQDLPAWRPGDCPCQLRTADLWAWCARAIASLAHQPGGITFMGDHWEVPPRGGAS